MRRVLCFALLGLLSCKPATDPNKGRYSCSAAADCGDGYECRPQFAGGGRCFKLGECVAVEQCNGTDDNCDGRIDESFPEQGVACPTGLAGLCATGGKACVAGTIVCAQTIFPVPEVCNGLDDNCDGGVDETFDLTTDSRNCGACGHVCDAGTSCRASTCMESDCANGLDDDNNGKTDCEDDACFGLECFANQPPVPHCGAVPVPFADGGYPDAGPRDGGVDGGVDAGVDGGSDGGTDAGWTVKGCYPPETDCANGYDDDGDGLVDCLDPDCDGRTCFSGTVCTLLACPGPG
jgi:hypothetical protein